MLFKNARNFSNREEAHTIQIFYTWHVNCRFLPVYSVSKLLRKESAVIHANRFQSHLTLNLDNLLWTAVRPEKKWESPQRICFG